MVEDLAGPAARVVLLGLQVQRELRRRLEERLRPGRLLGFQELEAAEQVRVHERRVQPLAAFPDAEPMGPHHGQGRLVLSGLGEELDLARERHGVDVRGEGLMVLAEHSEPALHRHLGIPVRRVQLVDHPGVGRVQLDGLLVVLDGLRPVAPRLLVADSQVPVDGGDLRAEGGGLLPLRDGRLRLQVEQQVAEVERGHRVVGVVLHRRAEHVDHLQLEGEAVVGRHLRGELEVPSRIGRAPFFCDA